MEVIYKPFYATAGKKRMHDIK